MASHLNRELKLNFPRTLEKVKNNEIENGTYNIPSVTTHIESSAFENCDNLKFITIPNSVIKIDYGAFSDCTSLESIDLSDNISFLSTNIFSNCTSLKNVKLPKDLINIRAFAFNNCTSLKNIKLPQNLREIEDGAFYNCSSLESISVPSYVNNINRDTFNNCTSLKKVELPSNIDKIEIGAFENCGNLKEITMPKKLSSIGSRAFFNCNSIKSIKLPKKLLYINNSAFHNCSALESIDIPRSVEEIGENAFRNCTSAKTLNLPGFLNTINKSAFQNCELISTVKLPFYTKKVGVSAFENCTALEDLRVNTYLEVIDDRAFANCKSLKNVKLHYTLKHIGKSAFEDCDNLKTINIPDSVFSIGSNVFNNCKKLEHVYVPQTVCMMKNIGNCSLKYFTKDFEEGGFHLSSTPTENSVPLENINVDLAYLSYNWEDKDLILKETANKNVSSFYNSFLVQYGNFIDEEFKHFHNFTFLKKFDLTTLSKDKLAFFNLLYNLGGLNKPIKVNDKTFDYAQKVSEFILEKVRKNGATLDDFSMIGSEMKTTGFNKEFTDFFLNNFDDLLVEEKKDNGFIAKCYNEFEQAQLGNTSNRGSQRQLKPTIAHFKDYFSTNKFSNVTPETLEIAKTISPYFSDQGTFNIAVGIERERIEEHTPNNILKKPLKETPKDTEKYPFDNIDKLSNAIKSKSFSTLDRLITIADNEFTFEWLEKNDPTNLILGKLCSCCAHLEAVGFGIMHASIVNPNVQNLVIRNGKGKIIAKSTFYINRQEGYGIFNNVEVNEFVPSKSKRAIYEKYILGVKRFIEEYNKENPKNPLKQVNVGMNLNDLESEIMNNHKEQEGRRLPAINYGDYGFGLYNYSGDSKYCQYIIWRAEDEKYYKNRPIVPEKQN